MRFGHLAAGFQFVVAGDQRVSVRRQSGAGVRFDRRQRLAVLVPGDVQQQFSGRWIALRLLHLQLDGQFHIIGIDRFLLGVLRQHLGIV